MPCPSHGVLGTASAVGGAEEPSLDAKHVLFRDVGLVLGGVVWARLRQGH